MRADALRLAAALDAGDLDAEAPRLGALGALLRATALAGAGRLAAARGLAEAALADRSDHPGACIAAAAVLHATRDYQRSLDALAAARAAAPAASKAAAQRAIAYASALGWEREVAAAIAVGRAADPRDPLWDALEAQMHLRGGDLPAAIAAARSGLSLAPGSARLRMELAAALAASGDDAAARDEVERALALAPRSAPHFRRAAVWTLLDAGDFSGARAQAEAALQGAPDPALALALADLSLWEGDAQAALRRADAADDRAGALRLRGQVSLQAGRIEAARAALTASLAARETAEALRSLAEVHLRAGELPAAHAALDRAAAIGEGYVGAAWMLRFLAAARERPDPRAPVNPRQVEEFAELLAELCPGADAALAAGLQGPLVDATEAALRRLGCNRSPLATYLDGARLRRVRTRTGVRHASRQALQRIRTAAPEQVLADFDAVIARWPRSSLPLAHRGELRMWLGDDAAAEADLAASIAINPRTRWAYVGLTLLRARAGDAAGAAAVSELGISRMRGTVGPAVYAHRGAASRLAGALAAARADLERAVETHPARVGAWVDLGLTFGTCADAAGLSRCWEHLRAAAPGLVSDAARVAGVVAWGEGAASPDAAGQAAVLGAALGMLRGNRSSTCVTYLTPAGQLRTVPHGPGAAGRHARDREDLAGARAVLLRALGAA